MCVSNWWDKLFYSSLIDLNSIEYFRNCVLIPQEFTSPNNIISRSNAANSEDAITCIHQTSPIAYIWNMECVIGIIVGVILLVLHNLEVNNYVLKLIAFVFTLPVLLYNTLFLCLMKISV